MHKILIALSLILSLSLASAELIISPNNLQIDTTVGETKAFNMTLTNGFPFTIKDFQFSNLQGFTFPSIQLAPNETRAITFTVTRNSSQQQTINSQVIFNYVVSVPSNPQTFSVNITSSGYKPSFLAIHQDDTVLWKNTDDITHTVTSSLFDSGDLAPNQTYSRTFNQVETVSYQDSVLFFGGTIEILNKSGNQNVHNPDYDKVITVQLTVSGNPTQLEFSNADSSNYTVPSAGSTEGLVRVRNPGSSDATFIQLTSDSSWIKFQENNFNLAPGQQRFIKYTIAPFIITTNDTDKHYSIRLRAKASNSNESSFAVVVYIPFENIDADPSNPAKLGDILTRFCRENPAACQPSSGGNGSVIIRDPEVIFNASTSQVLDYFRRVQRLEDGATRSDNSLNALLDRIARENPEMFRILNESLARSIETDKRSRRDKNVIWILGLFILIGSIVTYCFYRYRKYSAKKNMAEGYMP